MLETNRKKWESNKLFTQSGKAEKRAQKETGEGGLEKGRKDRGGEGERRKVSGRETSSAWPSQNPRSAADSV